MDALHLVGRHKSHVRSTFKGGTVAEVTSGSAITVIILDNEETEELTELLVVSASIGTLDELTSALAGIVKE